MKGSAKELFPIALPIFLSQAIDVAMIFCDRIFLARVSKEELAATLAGGIFIYMITTLITGVLGQINPLVAQNIGAGRRRETPLIVHQGLFLSVIAAPVIFFLGRLAAPPVFRFFNHGEVLLTSEIAYFEIISLTIFLVTIRQTFANFFIGIGRPRIVTVSTIAAVLANLPLAYGLIFGAWGLPRLEIRGAAWATVIASVVPVVILALRFFSRQIDAEFGTRKIPRFDFEILKNFLRYGAPAGAERFVNVGGFMFFTMVMYSFSPDVAAATTIALNWDMVSFLPLLGVSEGASSLVGRYLGARDKDLALKSAWSGIKLGWIYSGAITLLYFTATLLLVRLFAPNDANLNYAEVERIAVTLLKISCIYFFCDGTYSVLGGILRGAGDTVWIMVVSNSMMWTTAVAVYVLKDRIRLTPIGAWYGLTIMVFSLGLVFFWRFFQKKWLNRLMITA